MDNKEERIKTQIEKTKKEINQIENVISNAESMGLLIEEDKDELEEEKKILEGQLVRLGKALEERAEIEKMKKELNDVNKTTEKVFKKQDFSPEFKVGDKEGYGSAYLFKSKKGMQKYGERYSETCKNYKKIIEILKTLSTKEESRKELLRIFQESYYANKENRISVTSEELKRCYYLLDKKKKKTKHIRYLISEAEKKCGHKLVPCCMVVPDDIWKNMFYKPTLNSDSNISISDYAKNYVLNHISGYT
ncbi:MAG: hypothetical protein KAQ92_02525, partial [Candidatus Aenigmarchaeota archaeon]|nr:hypothetical protein [Candidatus Aenigmarchaeota archaeon]